MGANGDGKRLCEPAKTLHMASRQTQRHISDRDVELAMAWGRFGYSGRDMVFWLGRRWVDNALAVGVDIGTAAGVAVVVTAYGVWKTAWRNKVRPGMPRGNVRWEN